VLLPYSEVHSDRLGALTELIKADNLDNLYISISAGKLLHTPIILLQKNANSASQILCIAVTTCYRHGRKHDKHNTKNVGALQFVIMPNYYYNYMVMEMGVQIKY